MRQLRTAREHAIYVSADTLEPDTDLFDLIRRLNGGYGFRRFFIDEIHFLRRYPAALKRIYDFLEVRLWFTSSVALSLTRAGWDLSRRVRRMTLYPFSLREFAWFTSGEERRSQPLPPLTLAAVLTRPVPAEYLRLGSRFHEYMTGGLYPFQLPSSASLDLFENTLEKVITGDIPNFDPTLTTEDTDNMRRVLTFIGRSAVDGINYSSVSRNVGITKYKAEQCLNYLERSFLISRVLPAGTNVLKEPKVLMQPPYRLLYAESDTAIGALREDFFVLASAMHGHAIHYAKSTRGAKTPDYVTAVDGETAVVQIGGRGKGRSQFKGLSYDRKIVLYDGSPSEMQPGERVPLFCAGLA